MNSLKKVQKALKAVTGNVGHYDTLEESFPRIVWAEDDADGLRADNSTRGQIWSGTIDLFSYDEFDPLFMALQDSLNNAGISFKLVSTQHEEETGVVHWEWAFSVV